MNILQWHETYSIQCLSFFDYKCELLFLFVFWVNQDVVTQQKYSITFRFTQINMIKIKIRRTKIGETINFSTWLGPYNDK